MKTLAWMAIPLSQGLFALVDGKDYEWLSQWKWHAHKDRNTYYAKRTNHGNSKDISIRMHRLLLQLPPNILTDHKNRNGLDNRRQNLRLCTYSQNRMNSKKRSNCSSKYKGVSWYEQIQKWAVCICLNEKIIRLGCFDSEIEAATVYDKKAKELFGEFARTNF